MEWLKLRERSFTEWSRWFVMLAVGLTVGVVSYTFVASTPVSAVDGEWDDQAIVYGGESYQPVRDTGEMARKLGLPQGTRIYAIESQAGNTTTVKAVYFTPGTDIGQANSAQTATFTINRNGQAEKKDEKQISLTPAGESVDIRTGECGVENVGWAVCPISNFLATTMDTVYSGILRYFLDVRRLNVTDRHSGIYIAWSIMLSFANIAFIAGFLALIYSYLTSVGISNYGIKRMLPRLMVAAILVNLSFYICAIAIDLSNISGRAIQDVFTEIRNTVANTAAGGVSDQATTWTEVTLAALTGVGMGIVAVDGAITSAAPWIMPALVGAGLALLVVVIVLAARQALIVILTIISPLAFVAYIFPGTEKWFDKWRDLFFTMLVFFPAFSAVFGGAQLAGLVIIQNADSIVMTILGLAVQVAPLAIAPLVMKLSGGLLNRFAGILNNPQRGLFDKSKQWAEKKSEQMRNRALYGKDGLKNDLNPMHRFGRWMQRGNTLLDDKLEDSRNVAHVGRRNHYKYRAFDKRRQLTEMSKQTFDKDLEHSRNHYVRTTSDGTNAHLRLRAITDQADESAKRLDAQYEDFRTGKDRVYTDEMARLQQSAMQTQESAFLTDQRISMAKAEQSQRIADRMTANTAQVLDNNSRLVSYLDYAGGVSGSSGATAALANAIAARNKAHVEGVQEAAAIQNHFKLTGEQRSSLINGNDVQITNESGQVVYTFKSTDRAAVEAASAEQFRIGTYAQKLEVALQTNHAVLDPATGSVQAGLTHDIRSAVSDAAAANSIAKTAVFLGGKTIEDMKTGTMTIEQAIVQTIAGGKVKDIDLSSNDADALRAMFEFDQRLVPADKLADFQAGIQALRESAWRILKSPELSANGSASSKRVLEQYAVRPPKDI